MSELLDAAVSPANLIITSLFIFMILYWIVVVVGVIDLDFFDVDVDLDLDADVDADFDLDTETEITNAAYTASWFNSALVFFNLGQIPLMIFLSFLIIPCWVIVMIINHNLGISSFLPGLLVFSFSFIISLFIAKFSTIPFIKVFGKMNDQSEKQKKLLGKVCRVTIRASSDKVGQAQIDTKGAPYIINVKTPNGVTIEKGDSALVIDYISSNNVYLIEPYN